MRHPVEFKSLPFFIQPIDFEVHSKYLNKQTKYLWSWLTAYVRQNYCKVMHDIVQILNARADLETEK